MAACSGLFFTRKKLHEAQMKLYALKPMNPPKMRPVRKGAIVEIPEPWASRYIAMGAAERYESKISREGPTPAAGSALPSSALPAAQVSQTNKSKKSEKPAGATPVGSLL